MGVEAKMVTLIYDPRSNSMFFLFGIYKADIVIEFQLVFLDAIDKLLTKSLKVLSDKSNVFFWESKSIQFRIRC